MNIYEHQAKDLLRSFNIPLLLGSVAYSMPEAVQVSKNLGGSFWVVKAQIHAGGRGKAGGIILCHSLTEVEQATEKLLHHPLVTPQTGAQGQQVKCVYIEQGCEIAREIYLSFTLNRHDGRVCLIASKGGGIAIEETAHHNPDSIEQIVIDPMIGLQPFHSQRLTKFLDLKEHLAEKFHTLITNLYLAYLKLDATLLEINPLVITAQGGLMALDAKMSFDDNALYRQPVLKTIYNQQDETSSEHTAHHHGLSYVKLDGTIGCMVNGAGLAMATLDLIQFYGAKPANFLDVGGSADEERVKLAFQLILADPNVRAILINIFGGIIRCDVIAQGIIAAAKEAKLTVPIVVRLQGTHHQEAAHILSQSGLKLITADTLDEAAKKVIHAAHKHP